jgi:uncharacterized damage-inducible protein DinB
MDLETLQTYYRYGTWATNRIFDTAASLTQADLQRPAPGAFGPFRDTYAHLIRTEELWLARMQESAMPEPADTTTYPDIPALRDWWERVDLEMTHFIIHLPPFDLNRMISYVNQKGETWSYPLWQMLLHQQNHATQHRSELAMTMTAWGHSPGWLDFLVFIDEENGAHIERK